MEKSIAKLLIEAGKSIYARIKKHNDYKAIFAKSGKAVLAIEADSNSDPAEKISILFSDENIERLAEESKTKNGYELLEYVIGQLRTFFNPYDLEHWDLERFLDVFKYEFIQHLKCNCPDLYDQYYACETRDVLSEGQRKILDEVNYLRNLLTDVEQYGLTLYETENILRNSTGEYQLDLDFFDYGEKQIDEIIVSELKTNNVLNVKFRSKEEGKYYILRLVKYYLPDQAKKVLVVEQQDQWQRLTKTAKGLVLIPVFTASRINLIPGNKVVFIYTDEDFAGKEQMVFVPNRIKTNLFHKLNSYVDDYEKTNWLIERTSGVFATLMRRLSSDYVRNPEWLTGDEKVLVPAALLGAWSIMEGDQMIVSKLACMAYDDFIAKIRPYLIMEDPLLVRYASLSGHVYKSADLFEAIACLKVKIDKVSLDRFMDCVLEVLISPHAHTDESGIRVFDGKYSFYLKKGMATSLVAMALDKGEYADDRGDYLAKFARDLIKKVLERMKTASDWEAVCELLSLLIEAAPSEVLDRIESAVVTDEKGFWSLFVFGKSVYNWYLPYSYVLNALAVALFIEDVSIRTLRILEHIADKDIDYKRNESPVSILSRYYLELFNGAAITEEKNLTLLRSYAANHPHSCWYVLKNVLPALYSAAYVPLPKPLYVSSNVVDKQQCKMNIQLFFKTIAGFFQIAFTCAGNDLTKWADFFDNGMFISIGLTKEYVFAVNRLLTEETYTDEAKYQFEKTIRRFLYRNRYFERSAVFKKEDLAYIEENLLVTLQYRNSLYKVLYAFDEMWLDIHPVTMEEEKTENYQRNINKRNEEQQRLLAENLQTKQFELKNLVLKAADRDDLGRNILTVCHKGGFDVDFSYYLYKSGRINIMHGYMVGAFGLTNNDCFFAFLNQLSEPYSEVDFKFQLLEAHRIDDDFLVRLQDIDSVLCDYYWKNTRNAWFDEDNFGDIEQYVLNSVRNGNYHNALNLVYRYDFSLDTCISILISVHQFFNNYIEVNSIQKVFEKIYKFNITDSAKANTVIQLEIAFLHTFYNNKPKFLLKRLKCDPTFSVELLSDIYRREHEAGQVVPYDGADGSEDNETIINRAKRAFDILYNVKFCPCEMNGTVDETKLSQWCDVFLKEMGKIDRLKRGHKFLGNCLANCPSTDNGDIWPAPAVCKEIEKHYLKEFWNEFRVSFVLGVLSNRGVHAVNSGEEEKHLAQKYDNYAKQADLLYPATASLLREIRDNYNNEAHELRSSAEFE